MWKAEERENNRQDYIAPASGAGPANDGGPAGPANQGPANAGSAFADQNGIGDGASLGNLGPPAYASAWQPGRKRTRWSPDEEKLLVKGVTQYGPRWTKILCRSLCLPFPLLLSLSPSPSE